MLTPPVRAAFARVLALLPGVSAAEVRIAGTLYYEVRSKEQGLLFDEATGASVGSRWHTAGTASVTRWHAVAVNSTTAEG